MEVALTKVTKDARVLIVDDEVSNVRLLEFILEDAGYTHVHGTTDSRQSLALFRSVQPDIVLLDLAMPHLDGFAVMQQLQQEMVDNSVPILVLTADATSSARHKALREGASDFLTKPLDQTEVLLRINNLLKIRLHNLVLEATVRERTHDLEDSRAQLRALTAGLTSLIEEERTQISREIHDDLGQALTGLKMDVSWLEERLPSNDAASTLLRAKTRSMVHLIDTTIGSVQRIASQLRPALLDDLGLEAAIEWQLQQFQERTDTHCDFVSSLGEVALSSEQATAAFRIFQEAITNVIRHAAAKRVSVLLEENAGRLVLEVQDDGRGMDDPLAPGANAKSLGLLGMQERARLVGGKVTICGKAGKGTTVTVRIPLNQEQICQELDPGESTPETSREEDLCAVPGNS